MRFCKFLPIFGEYSSELSYFISELINFAEATRLSEEIKKPCLKATLKKTENLINNRNFLVQDSEKGEPVTPCMDVYKAKNQSYRSLDKLKSRIVVRQDLQNKELGGDNWSSTASMRTLKYFVTDEVKHKARVHKLDFIGVLFQAKVKNMVSVKLDSRYVDYFTEYLNYFVRALRLLKSTYGMANYGKLFSDELAECLLEAGLIQSQCQMFIYYKYAPDGTKVVVLSYVDDYVYWYTSEYIVKWFVCARGKRLHVNFLGYANWSM